MVVSMRASEFPMNLTKFGYFAEFVVFPPLVIFSTALALHEHSSALRLAIWLSAYGIGVGAWTVVEYLVHRFIFHGNSVLARMHDRHHANPRELIGSPAWASGLLGLIGIVVPSWALFGFYLATAVTGGIVTGYLWYVFVHYSAHHGEPGRGSYLYRARLRHARHHYRSHDSDFGVTTEFWDRAFGTVAPRRPRSVNS
jgi:sterol desaturase/sphingolipid hydroxylase (fatty acid hydroxylase superfamily)